MTAGFGRQRPADDIPVTVLPEPGRTSSTNSRASIYVDYFTTFWRVADKRCRRYYGSDKPSAHAAGLESLVYFAGLVIELMPGSWRQATIIDAGAGASSAILRTYFEDVISCDPDGDYLEYVRRTCAELGLPRGQWVAGIPTEEADATFYDYGDSQRVRSFPPFLDLTRRLIWVDDAQWRDLFDDFAAVCRERGLELRRARGVLDNVGRFGAYAAIDSGGPISRGDCSEIETLRNELNELHLEWKRERAIHKGQAELLKLLETSWSWRLTRPVRTVGHKLHLRS